MRLSQMFLGTDCFESVPLSVTAAALPTDFNVDALGERTFGYNPHINAIIVPLKDIEPFGFLSEYGKAILSVNAQFEFQHHFLAETSAMVAMRYLAALSYMRILELAYVDNPNETLQLIDSVRHTCELDRLVKSFIEQVHEIFSLAMTLKPTYDDTWRKPTPPQEKSSVEWIDPESVWELISPTDLETSAIQYYVAMGYQDFPELYYDFKNLAYQKYEAAHVATILALGGPLPIFTGIKDYSGRISVRNTIEDMMSVLPYSPTLRFKSMLNVLSQAKCLREGFREIGKKFPNEEADIPTSSSLYVNSHEFDTIGLYFASLIRRALALLNINAMGIGNLVLRMKGTPQAEYFNESLTFTIADYHTQNAIIKEAPRDRRPYVDELDVYLFFECIRQQLLKKRGLQCPCYAMGYDRCPFTRLLSRLWHRTKDAFDTELWKKPACLC